MANDGVDFGMRDQVPLCLLVAPRGAQQTRNRNLKVGEVIADAIVAVGMSAADVEGAVRRVQVVRCRIRLTETLFIFLVLATGVIVDKRAVVGRSATGPSRAPVRGTCAIRFGSTMGRCLLFLLARHGGHGVGCGPQGTLE